VFLLPVVILDACLLYMCRLLAMTWRAMLRAASGSQLDLSLKVAFAYFNATLPPVAHLPLHDRPLGNKARKDQGIVHCCITAFQLVPGWLSSCSLRDAQLSMLKLSLHLLIVLLSLLPQLL
jgi:hypothetical protein